MVITGIELFWTLWGHHSEKSGIFSHAPRCGSTESGCEISVPWWLILADLGKMTSVWSRDRDTGDTSEHKVDRLAHLHKNLRWSLRTHSSKISYSLLLKGHISRQHDKSTPFNLKQTLRFKVYDMICLKRDGQNLWCDHRRFEPASQCCPLIAVHTQQTWDIELLDESWTTVYDV